MTILQTLCATCLNQDINKLKSINEISDGVSLIIKLIHCIPQYSSQQFELQECFLCEMCITYVNDVYNFQKRCMESKAWIEDLLEKICNDIVEPEASLKDDDETVVFIQENNYFIIQNSCMIGDTDDTFEKRNDTNVFMMKQQEDNNKNDVNLGINQINELENGNDTNVSNNFRIIDDIIGQNEMNNVFVGEQQVVDNNNKIDAMIIDTTVEKNKLNGKISNNSIINNKNNTIPVSTKTKRRIERNKTNKKIKTTAIKVSYKCKKCSRTFIDRGRFNIHVRHTHKSENVCSICDKSFISHVFLIKHVKQKHNNYPYLCKNCVLPCNTLAELLKHKEIKKCENKVKSLENKKVLNPKIIEYIDLVDEVEHLGNKMEDKRSNIEVDDVEIVEIKKQPVKKNYKSNYSCILCDKTFDYKTSYKAHMKSMHEYKTDVCPYCSESFSNKSDHRLHIKNNHRDRLLQCDICKESFIEIDLLKHKETMKCDIKNTIQCLFCEKEFKKDSTLDEHLYQIHNKEKYFSCHICKKKFLNKLSLNIHKRYRHQKTFKNQHVVNVLNKENTQKNNQKCGYCDKTYPTSKMLKRHVTAHKKNKIHQCEYCGKTYTSSLVLERHITDYHSDKKYTCCDICSRKFLSKYLCNQHKEKSHLTTNFLCEYCANGFSNKKLFLDHINQHKGIKNYKCKICKRDYYLQHTYQRHIQQHKTKKFVCSYCKCRFDCVRGLNNHLRMHKRKEALLGERRNEKFFAKYKIVAHLHFDLYKRKPFACNTCRKRFDSMSKLIIHKNSHSKVKRYRCHSCNFVCKCPSSLRKHTHVKNCKDRNGQKMMLRSMNKKLSTSTNVRPET